MGKDQSSYKQVFKATSIFGGVEVFKIVIRIIRIKFVAVLLGPAGLGIAGLLGSTTGIITSLTSFGLGTSAVKEIAGAFGSGDQKQVSKVVTVLRRLVWITGILGAVIMLIFSTWLSELTFGNKDYSFSFILISVTLLFNQISNGQGVVLRGLRKVRYLAQASMIGSVLGLITNIPLYYFYGVKGIVPGIILTSITTLCLTWYFARKVKLDPVKVSIPETVAQGKDMLKFGFAISLEGLITVGAAYVIKIFVSNSGGVEEVGLYTAGFSIINSYVGMIFTAMGQDYYPRLSAVNKDSFKINKTVTEQAVIALIIMVPIIIIFLIYSPLLIQLLYSSEFLAMEEMITWAILGMVFRALSWSIGYVILAKGDSKLFIRTTIGFNLIFLLTNIFGYELLGLMGLGVTFLINYIIHFVAIYFIARKRYQFQFNSEIYPILMIGIPLCFVGFIITFISNENLKYGLGTFLIIIGIWLSFRELNKRVNLRNILNKFKK